MRTHEEAAKEWFRSWNTLDRDAFYGLLAPDFVGKGAMRRPFELLALPQETFSP